MHGNFASKTFKVDVVGMGLKVDVGEGENTLNTILIECRRSLEKRMISLFMKMEAEIIIAFLTFVLYL